MLVKTFQAPTMAEALRLVKAELGPDAMILSTKKEQIGGILGFFSKQVVKVTAAIDPQRPAPSPPPPPKERPERERTAKEEFENSMLGPLARELKELRERVEMLARKDEAGRNAASPPSAEVQQRPEADAALNLNNIPRQDIEEIKKLLLNTLVKSQEGGVKTVQWPDARTDEGGSRGGAEPDEAISPLQQELERQGISPEIKQKILETMQSLPVDQSEQSLKGRLGQAFGRLIKFAGLLRLKKNAPRIIALVGPTGVGKTTTTAKLAAMYALNRGNKVALITMDIFRVGAVEQLKTYSRIMGIPLEVASTAKELEKAIKQHSQSDLILIDTAGRSHKDSEKLEEMKSFLENTVQPDIFLCLSATTKDRELEEILNRFSILPISKVVFTKVDECESIGCIINLLLKTNLQLAYFTNGQRVPEDIEVATSDKLAELMLREGAE
ncbi:flagellar biosynthesis protein FlhF [Trichlorobacter ammonificans]|uniref:Flagellar biosynthesis protein FlhF n=1 Tax=Trichlorobacter ammonificans TaxID=2916410 RepID=A0ABM9D6J8_9BACT|nr:flagellar biosynthesis protein FlhF [Trichlorobacter ammonificans]CAH2030005.1 Flagellar biosynthesis protein FlhF [Trichlorobacter ammonificans]